MADEKTNKKPIYKKVWFWILVIVIIGVVASTAGGRNNVINNDSTKTSTSTTEKFTLQEGHKGSTDQYGMSYTIEGAIKNNTNKTYSYVQVTFNLYDNDGAQIGTALANINNLEAEGLWKFKAIGSFGDGKTVTSYKLMEITGW